MKSELFFPQVADGEGYSTKFTLVNPGNTPVTALLELFQPSGAAQAFNLNGKLDNAFLQTIPANGMIVLESPGTGILRSGWARVRSSALIGGSILYAGPSAFGPGVSDEAGIDPSLPTSSFCMSVDTRRGFYSGLAVANPGLNNVTLEMTLYRNDGVQLSQKRRTLLPMNQFAALAGELFPDVNLGNFMGVMTVTTAGGPVVASTLRFNGNFTAFASIPVIRATGSSGPMNLLFPQVADGGGYKTSFILVNPGTTSITAVLEAFRADGGPLRLNLNGTIDSRFSVTLPAHGLVFLESNNSGATTQSGWARLGASGPIGGSVVYGAYSPAAILLSEAGIDPADPAGSFSLSVDTRRGFLAGLAVANPNNSGTSIDLALYNRNGLLISTQSRALGGFGQFARLVGELFPGVNLDNFAGVIKATASSGNLAGTTLRFNGSQSVMASIPVIYGSAITPPPTGSARGSLESPREGDTVSGTVTGSGWAFILTGDTGVLPSKVEVYIDGALTTQAELGLPRPDVVAAFPGITVPVNSGYRFTWNSSTVSSGSHRMCIRVADAIGAATEAIYEITCINFNVAQPPPPPPPKSIRANLDSPTNSQSVSCNVTGGGWAFILSGSTGALPARIEIRIDGNAVGQATLGISRPDVPSAFPGIAVPANTGFTFTWDSSSASIGRHTLSVLAFDSDGKSYSIAEVQLNVMTCVKSLCTGLWSGAGIQLWLSECNASAGTGTISTIGSPIVIPPSSGGGTASMKLGPVRVSNSICSGDLTLYVWASVPIANARLTYQSTGVNVQGAFNLTDGTANGTFTLGTSSPPCGYLSGSGTWYARRSASGNMEVQGIDAAPEAPESRESEPEYFWVGDMLVKWVRRGMIRR